MKYISLTISTLFIITLSACTTHSDDYYDRANRASEKSLQGLDKEY